jgi:predicted O-methyltransferase YrrM
VIAILIPGGLTARLRHRDVARPSETRVKRFFWRHVHPRIQRLADIATPDEKLDMICGFSDGERVLVETGTYRGDTAAGCARHFPHVYTIELDPSYAARARQRFANTPNVTVIEGDSETELPRLAGEIDGPAVFWLDAHFCDHGTAYGQRGSALSAELEAIRTRHQPDVVLIDDARHTGYQPGPIARVTRRLLRRWFYPLRSGYPSFDEIIARLDGRIQSVDVRGDVIRLQLAGPES